MLTKKRNYRPYYLPLCTGIKHSKEEHKTTHNESDCAPSTIPFSDLDSEGDTNIRSASISMICKVKGPSPMGNLNYYGFIVEEVN
uniref:Uncharacterized protein n=1 Tax=Romanomermis culicivorax TaxID=13658 RepID=A0A915ID62_ROMCU